MFACYLSAVIINNYHSLYSMDDNACVKYLEYHI